MCFLTIFCLFSFPFFLAFSFNVFVLFLSVFLFYFFFHFWVLFYSFNLFYPFLFCVVMFLYLFLTFFSFLSFVLFLNFPLLFVCNSFCFLYWFSNFYLLVYCVRYLLVLLLCLALQGHRTAVTDWSLSVCYSVKLWLSPRRSSVVGYFFPVAPHRRSCVSWWWSGGLRLSLCAARWGPACRTQRLGCVYVCVCV